MLPSAPPKLKSWLRRPLNYLSMFYLKTKVVSPAQEKRATKSANKNGCTRKKISPDNQKQIFANYKCKKCSFYDFQKSNKVLILQWLAITMLSIVAFTSLAIWMLQNGICTFQSVGQVKWKFFIKV